MNILKMLFKTIYNIPALLHVSTHANKQEAGGGGVENSSPISASLVTMVTQ